MHPPGDPGFDVIRARAKEWDSPLIGIPDRGATDVGTLRKLGRICRELDVKIWHAHDYKSNLFGLLLRPLHRMELVTTVHGWVVRTARTSLYYRIDRFCLPRYDHVICVSEDLRETVATLGVKSTKLTYIPNAIDQTDYVRQGPSSEAQLRVDRGTAPGRIVIGAVGRLMPEKSFELAIQVVKNLLDRGHDVELWIAGEGPSRQSIESRIIDLGVRDRVHLLGFCADVKAFYESLDVFLLSSQREGLPNVILEAAAFRLPIVSTRVAGVPSMLEDRVDCLLCEIDDEQGMTNALCGLLNDENHRTSIASAARNKIEKSYTFGKRMERVCDLYDTVLKESLHQ